MSELCSWYRFIEFVFGKLRVIVSIKNASKPNIADNVKNCLWLFYMTAILMCYADQDKSLLLVCVDSPGMGKLFVWVFYDR